MRVGLGLIACMMSGVAMSTAMAADNELYLYNWADYIAPSVIQKFEAETGIHVVYDTYDNDATPQAKLLAGNSGYDVVLTPVSSYGAKLIQAKIFREIDKASVPNFGQFDQELTQYFTQYDPGLKYSMPYTWGTTGFAYNEAMIKERMDDAPVDSLKMFFDSEVVSKFADCGVTVFDEPVSVVPMALLHLGLDPNSENPEDYEKAGEALKKIRKYVRAFDNIQYSSALPNKSVCLAMAYNGYYVNALKTATDAKIDVNLRYTVPVEGSNIWADAMMIPSDARNPALAEQFLNFLQKPEIAAENTDFIGFANANKAATGLVSLEIRDNKAIYPPSNEIARGYAQLPLNSKIEKLRVRTFEAFKTAE